MSLTMQSGILLTKKNDRTANLSRSISTGVPITVTAVYEQKHPPRSNRNIPANGHRIREKNMNKLNKAWECNLRSTGIILDNLRYILYIYIYIAIPWIALLSDIHCRCRWSRSRWCPRISHCLKGVSPWSQSLLIPMTSCVNNNNNGINIIIKHNN